MAYLDEWGRDVSSWALVAGGLLVLALLAGRFRQTTIQRLRVAGAAAGSPLGSRTARIVSVLGAALALNSAPVFAAGRKSVSPRRRVFHSAKLRPRTEEPPPPRSSVPPGPGLQTPVHPAIHGRTLPDEGRRKAGPLFARAVPEESGVDFDAPRGGPDHASIGGPGGAPDGAGSAHKPAGATGHHKSLDGESARKHDLEREMSKRRHPAGKGLPSNGHRGGRELHDGPAYVVRPGDSLWSIASSVLRTDDVRRIARYWPRLHRLNRAVVGPDPSLIFPGQKLRLPDEHAS